MVQNREVYSQWKICVLQTMLSDIARLGIFFFQTEIVEICDQNVLNYPKSKFVYLGKWIFT